MNPQQIVKQSQDQKRYPMKMTHRQHRKATISGYVRNRDGSATSDPPGVVGQFYDHYVYNADQEAYYASMGYAPEGCADPEAYRREVCGMEKPVDNLYPKAVYMLKADGSLDSAVVNDERHDEKMKEDGWHDSPGDAQKSSAKKVVKIVELPESKSENIVEPQVVQKKKKRKPMSAEGRANIAAAIRRRAAEKKAQAQE
jgi:hypothetical protein